LERLSATSVPEENELAPLKVSSPPCSCVERQDVEALPVRAAYSIPMRVKDTKDITPIG